MVNSDCKSVRMRSSIFELEEEAGGFFSFFSMSAGDFVTIGETEYSGKLQIDTILSPNFTVAFQSDGSENYSVGFNKGFVLHWSCTQWGEWTRLKNGNCGYERRPLHNGTKTTGPLKYKFSETCSK